MIFNLVLFVMNCFFISLRFKWNPGSFRASFINQSESLFIPACVSVTLLLYNSCPSPTTSMVHPFLIVASHLLDVVENPSWVYILRLNFLPPSIRIYKPHR